MNHPNVELNTDDERAARLALIAALFMSDARPQPTSRILEEFYADAHTPESAKKAFLRDRRMLAQMGIVIVEAGRRDGEKCWAADKSASFADGAELGALEAIALNVACQPVLERPGFALAEDLRFALAKIDRTFGDATCAVQTRSLPASKAQRVISEAAAARHGVRIDYTDAAGKTSSRLWAPYGFFDLRGSAYLVAARLDEPNCGQVRTLRLDRVAAARPEAGATFEVPEGFCAQDWKLLPFQLGETTCVGEFSVPPEARGAFEDARQGRGELIEAAPTLIWRVDISDVDAAACWAVARGIVPTSPEPLVKAYVACLERTVAHA